MKKIFYILSIIILTACSSAITDTPSPSMENPVSSEDTPAPTPDAEETDQTRGNMYLNSSEILTMESYPLQFALVLTGDLPTPCHKLKAKIAPPDSENRIIADVYSTVNPDLACAQALQPFEENFPLGSFAAGHYTLWVNGKQIAEFDA